MTSIINTCIVCNQPIADDAKFAVHWIDAYTIRGFSHLSCSDQFEDITEEVTGKKKESRSYPETTSAPDGATHLRRPEYITAWLFDGVSVMPLWLIEKYHSQPLPEHRKGKWALAVDGEFWRWEDAERFENMFVAIDRSGGVAQTLHDATAWEVFVYARDALLKKGAEQTAAEQGGLHAAIIAAYE